MAKGIPKNGINKGQFIKGQPSAFKGKHLSEESKEKLRIAKRIPLEDRLLTKIDKTATCWLWTGAKNSGGYGNFSYRRPDGTLAGKPAHRAVYELLVSEIPEGLVMDHLCSNRICVNPKHLEPVTQAENVRRSGSLTNINASKTHCKHGHEFTTKNTYIHPTRRSRHCKLCGYISNKRYQLTRLQKDRITS